MREILFRGKRPYDGEWVYGFYVHCADRWGRDKDLIQSLDIESGEFSFLHEVDPETVGQYTGLTDKNGKKIFEGDIVVHEVQKGILFNKGVMNWDAKNARWAHQLNTMNPCLCMFDSSSHEVIGNIHDNPELLEAQS